MADRRDFLKASLAAGAGLVVGSVTPVQAGGTSGCPKGFVYTAADPGKWAGKEKTHAPLVSIDGDKVTIKTNHPFSEEHYIVRHTLLGSAGEVLGEKTFYPADGKAESVFELKGAMGLMYATSFCNKHDFWVAEFTV